VFSVELVALLQDKIFPLCQQTLEHLCEEELHLSVLTRVGISQTEARIVLAIISRREVMQHNNLAYFFARLLQLKFIGCLHPLLLFFREEAEEELRELLLKRELLGLGRFTQTFLVEIAEFNPH